MCRLVLGCRRWREFLQRNCLPCLFQATGENYFHNMRVGRCLCPLASLSCRHQHAPHQVFIKNVKFRGCLPARKMQHRARGFQIIKCYPSWGCGGCQYHLPHVVGRFPSNLVCTVPARGSQLPPLPVHGMLPSCNSRCLSHCVCVCVTPHTFWQTWKDVYVRTQTAMICTQSASCYAACIASTKKNSKPENRSLPRCCQRAADNIG